MRIKIYKDPSNIKTLAPKIPPPNKQRERERERDTDPLSPRMMTFRSVLRRDGMVYGRRIRMDRERERERERGVVGGAF